MTGGRVDHAAEARDFLVRADKQGTDVLGSELRMEALVHATLALVEQQRIANKLRVAAIDARTLDASRPFPVREYLTSDEWAGLDL